MMVKNVTDLNSMKQVCFFSWCIFVFEVNTSKITFRQNDL